MSLINERFNDWDQEVIDVDYQTSQLLRRNLNNALDNMIPNQSHVLEKVHAKTRMLRYTDPVFLFLREHHMNIYRESRHG